MILNPIRGGEYQWQSEKYGDVHVTILEDHAALAIEVEGQELPTRDENDLAIRYWWVDIITPPHTGCNAYVPQTELCEI